MAGNPRKKSVGAVFLALAAAVAIVVAWRHSPSADAPRGATRKHASHAAWLPWQVLRDDSAHRQGAAGANPDAIAYTGPRVPVRVKVVDLEGHPVADADVEARADADEYAGAGLTDEQYEAWAAAKYGADTDTAGNASASGEPPPGADGGDAWGEPEVRVAVESGRTDRDGVYLAMMKPDVSAVFWASDGDREGISGNVYVYAEQEGDASGDGPARGAPDGTHALREIDVTVEIARAGTLVGRVTDERGMPIGDAELRLSAWNHSDEDEEDFIVGAAPDDRLMTASDGSFRVRLRTSGAFDLEVHAKHFQPVLRQALQVLPGRETSVTITMSPSAAIMGMVVDPRGAPVAGARVDVQSDSRNGVVGAGYATNEATTDDAGQFLIDELAPDRFVVAASADGFRPVEQWGVLAGGPTVLLQLGLGATIHGSVHVSPEVLRSAPAIEDDGWGDDRPQASDSSDAPDANADASASAQGDVYLSARGDAQVSLATGVPRERAAQSPSGVLDARGRYFASIEFDASGRGQFDLTGLPAGDWDLSVVVGAAVTSIRDVRTREGATENVQVELPDRSATSITGIVRLASGGAPRSGSAFLYGPIPSGLSATLDAQGRFSFPSIPPGDYTLHAVAEGTANEMGSFAPARGVHVVAGQSAYVELVATRSGRAAPGSGTLTPQEGDGAVAGDDWAGDSHGANDDGGWAEGDSVPGDDGWGDPSGDPAAAAGDAAGDPHDVDDALDDAKAAADESGWSPDVNIEQIDDGFVVTSAGPGSDGNRLYGGDRVLSIDGQPLAGMEGWQAFGLIYGARGSICTIEAERPATQETVTVSMTRTRPPGTEDGGW